MKMTFNLQSDLEYQLLCKTMNFPDVRRIQQEIQRDTGIFVEPDEIRSVLGGLCMEATIAADHNVGAGQSDPVAAGQTSVVTRVDISPDQVATQQRDSRPVCPICKEPMTKAWNYTCKPTTDSKEKAFWWICIEHNDIVDQIPRIPDDAENGGEGA